MSAHERAPLLGGQQLPDVTRDPPVAEDGDVEACGKGRYTSARWLERKPEVMPGGAQRILRRGEVLGQSSGKWDIEHNWGKSDSFFSFRSRSSWSETLDKRTKPIWDAGRRMLYRTDPFHTLVNISTWKILLIVTMVYMAIFMGFGVVYWGVAQFPSWFGACGLVHQDLNGTATEGAPMKFFDALFFSVETQATIGYGAPTDIFFADCPLILLIITLQTVVGLFLDAALLGVLFNRVARGTPRANTILFSDRAVVRKIRGRYHFMFQVCEIRKHALLEAHVRVYTVRKDVDHLATGDVAYYQPFPMRLQHPDDELGGMLLMSLPNIVVHAMDSWSPLVPHPMDLRLWRAPASSPRVNPESQPDDDGDDEDDTYG